MSYIHIIYANLCKLFSFVLIAQHFQQEKWIDHDHFSPEANFHICNCSKSKDIRNQLIFPLQIWCHDISPISFFVSLKGVSPNCKLLQVQKCLYLHTYSSNLKHSEYSVISRGRSIWQNQLLDYRNSLKFSCGIASNRHQTNKGRFHTIHLWLVRMVSPSHYDYQCIIIILKLLTLDSSRICKTKTLLN